MAEAIRGMFVQGGSLHVTHDSGMWSVKDNGKEPNEWEVVPFSRAGISEEFIDFFSGELIELVEASSIYGAKRERLKEAIMTILTDGLMRAFEHLKKIRSSVISPVPELNRKQHYEDFAGVLWTAYKDLMPKATLLLGFDIGFQFQNDAKFKLGIDKFREKHTSLIMDIPKSLMRQRESWQQGLHAFRNDFLEHRSLEPSAVEKYYRPQWAEMVFDSVWRTMAEILPVFIEARFQPTLSIRPVPASQRNPIWPRRFQLFLCQPVDRSSS